MGSFRASLFSLQMASPLLPFKIICEFVSSLSPPFLPSFFFFFLCVACVTAYMWHLEHSLWHRLPVSPLLTPCGFWGWNSVVRRGGMCLYPPSVSLSRPPFAGPALCKPSLPSVSLTGLLTFFTYLQGHQSDWLKAHPKGRSLAWPLLQWPCLLVVPCSEIQWVEFNLFEFCGDMI